MHKLLWRFIVPLCLSFALLSVDSQIQSIDSGEDKNKEIISSLRQIILDPVTDEDILKTGCCPPQLQTPINQVYQCESIQTTPNEEEIVLGHIVPDEVGRVKIKDTSMRSSSAHGIDIVKFPNLENQCHETGFLIAPNFVLTAACNLYSHQYGEVAPSYMDWAVLQGLK